MKFRIALLAICSGPMLFAQEIQSSQVKRFVIYGSKTSDLPVALLRSQPVTIEWDMLTREPADLQLRFVHCDRDWNPTQTAFVNDPFRDRTRTELPYAVPPADVRGYSHTYQIRIPQKNVFDRFEHSGNYRVELWDRDTEERLAEGRFFVAEENLRPQMTVANRQEPSLVSPYYQVHRISVSFGIPVDSAGSPTLSTLLLTAVDVYKNREITRPHRIDVHDLDPHTFVNGFGTGTLDFIVDNVQPGNEYRTLDLRNIDFYPPGRDHGPRFGADVSRFLKKPEPDHNGGSTLVRGSRYADYLRFTFELLWDGPPETPVFVVGDFNGWKRSPESAMRREGDRHTWQASLRRGQYDYQYVLGDDWLALEGNDWRTINVYTAFVYYRDERFGGFDRIVGVARGRSPGGVTATVQ